MSVFLLSFGGIQNRGIHIPHLTPTLPWEQRWLAPFLHGQCCMQSSQGGDGELCVPSQGCTVSAEARHMDTWEQERVSWFCVGCCVQGMRGWEIVGLCACVWFWLLKHKKGESSPVWKYHLLRSWLQVPPCMWN